MKVYGIFTGFVSREYFCTLEAILNMNKVYICVWSPFIIFFLSPGNSSNNVSSFKKCNSGLLYNKPKTKKPDLSTKYIEFLQPNTSISNLV